MNLCECGCGEEIPDRLRFVKNHHRVYATGPDHYNWKGYSINWAGYRLISVGKDHPMADCRGQCMEHRLVMAESIGRMLHPEEAVHHINKVVDDNRIENLKLYATQAEHNAAEHPRERDSSGRFLPVGVAVS